MDIIRQHSKLDDTDKKNQDVLDVMSQNIDTALERGEKLEQLTNMSMDLQSHSKLFMKKSHKLYRRRMWTNVLTYFFCCPCFVISYC